MIVVSFIYFKGKQINWSVIKSVGMILINVQIFVKILCNCIEKDCVFYFFSKDFFFEMGEICSYYYICLFFWYIDLNSYRFFCILWI